MHHRVRFRRRTALSCAAMAFLAVAISCQEPTEVTVTVTTGEKCNQLSPVVVIVGPEPSETQKRFEAGFVTAKEDRCGEDGLVGTLVITPGGGGGSILVAVGVRGVDGTTAPDATQCHDPEVAKRCILARRTFTFINHKPLRLPINLDPLCLGKACDPASTCFKGACVDATVVCNDASCGIQEEHPGEIGVGEGGATEAGSSDGAYDADLDGNGSDVVDGSVVDGPTDSSLFDAGPDGTTAVKCADSAGVIVCDATMGYGVPYDCGNPMTMCCTCECPTNTKQVSCSGSPCYQSMAMCQ